MEYGCLHKYLYMLCKLSGDTYVSPDNLPMSIYYLMYFKRVKMS